MLGAREVGRLNSISIGLSRQNKREWLRQHSDNCPAVNYLSTIHDPDVLGRDLSSHAQQVIWQGALLIRRLYLLL